MIAAIGFAVRVILSGEMTSLGFSSLYYFAVGMTIPSAIYLMHSKEWARRNNPQDQNHPRKKKVLTRTWNNKVDFKALGICCVAAFLQMTLFYSVILAAQASRLSGLNLGIMAAVWSFLPFFVAVSERILYGNGVKPYQILGMILIVTMSVLVSLSDLFSA